MNITYNQKTDTLCIRFLDNSTQSLEHNSILIHRTTDGNLAALEIPNISKSIPLDSFKEIHLDLPTRSEETMKRYKQNARKK